MKRLIIITAILLITLSAWAARVDLSGTGARGDLSGSGVTGTVIGEGTPTVIAEQERTTDDARWTNEWNIGQSFTGTSDPLESIEVYAESGTGTLNCRIGTSDDLSSTYTEQLSVSISAIGWATLESLSNPQLTTGTWYIAFASSSNIKLSVEEAGSYAGGSYRYASTGTDYVITSEVSGRDLCFKITVSQ